MKDYYCKVFIILELKEILELFYPAVPYGSAEFRQM